MVASLLLRKWIVYHLPPKSRRGSLPVCSSLCESRGKLAWFGRLTYVLTCPHRFSSHAHRPHKPELLTRQAQVAFILSMPSQNRQAGHSSEDIVVGTTTVPYRNVDEDAEDDDFVRIDMLSEKAML